MADNYDSQERTEQATEKHLHDAREKGDVPRSQDLSAALVIAAVLGSIVALHTWLWGELDAYSTACRPGIPRHGGHRFHAMTAALSGE